jgi:hypothetical protein
MEEPAPADATARSAAGGRDRAGGKGRNRQAHDLLVSGLAGWGGRIRTSVWWNQNQAGPPTKSMRILNKLWNSTLNVSIG